ncbi:hypothetical protein JAAARDRAFT_61082 [Jaapia argillacea MUCL 33604]|uniref:F-box domain-containing protein n=1 Tax=Jaapia argillacea MUCL 33604 TaxID=933084 RepID=A0A067PIL1_9AGAM|nr:hypothetical protein JAAARDRAFT_61082 [Jaapia argillacea MUCL 33604]
MAHQSSPLCNLPREILENITVEAVLLDPIGPPKIIPALLATCKQIYFTLAFDNPNSQVLYGRVFKACFDSSAFKRRSRESEILPVHFAEQLRKNCDTLHFFKHATLHAPALEERFWEAVLMMVENDGRNQIQLEAVGVDLFVDRFIRARLWEDRGRFRGWPADNAINSLALWLHWFFTTKEKLAKEIPQDRWQMIGLVTPFVHLAFRYPTFYAPDIHYELPLVHSDLSPTQPHSSRTAHGPWPIYRSPTKIHKEIPHFGHHLRLTTPLTSTAAKLIYFARREVVPIRIPDILPPSRSLEYPTGPTKDDIHEFNAFPQAKLEETPRWNWWEGAEGEEGHTRVERKPPSARWDQEWERWCMMKWGLWRQPEGKGQVYEIGMLSGLWHGRMLVPSEPIYMDLVRTANMPPAFTQTDPFVNGRPVYMRIQEHHCISPNTPYPFANADEHGINNAWFPTWRSLQEGNKGRLTMYSMKGAKHIYETYVPGKKSSHSADRCVVCIRRAERVERGMLRRIRQREMECRLKDEKSRRHLEEDFEEMTLEDPEDEMGCDEVEMGCEDEDGIGSPEPEDEESESGSYGSEVSVESEVESEDEDDGRLCDGVGDIVFTGKTDTRHGEAWDAFQYYGRVRPYDGLIAIVRIPISPATGLPDLEGGRIIFRGYVHAGQTFVGTWRSWTPDGKAIPLEGPLVMSLRER